MKKIFLLLLILLVASCKPNQLIVHDIQYKDRVQHDSITTFKHDSIRITQKGDTVFFQTFKTLYRDRIKILTDSVIKYRDVPVPGKEKIVKVQTPLTWIQKTTMTLGKIFSILLLIGSAYFIVKLRSKFKLY
jgi:hypothetical protein